ncbi:hypothetical protein EM595_3161 [Duffyella gerundensis]|uniref:Uncharacterized protein n=1 Tax=Duffyella gerundensis TaxID=1619313 RepID=A0A0U5L8G0_9GAMM|nr:hypothetical protein EM595_3161 [Duffyella gerundensis]
MLPAEALPNLVIIRRFTRFAIDVICRAKKKQSC